LENTKGVSKIIYQNGELSDHLSGLWTETKLLHNKTELKRCSKTEIRWNQKLPS